MPRRSDETVAIRATAAGVGGIAVVEVLGPRALQTAGRFLKLRAGRIAHGRIVDEVLARYVPRSATGEPAVEISCHGGEQAVRVTIDALGVREVDRAFVLDRAVAARRLDRTREEAILLLPTALTPRAAHTLADQADGALARARRNAALLATAPLGCALVTPLRIAIAGRPNVGKSTLLNALVGRDRALVSPVAGTTRDPVEETIAIDGIPFVLVDTAGLSGAGDPLERLSMERARQEIARADLVLLLGGELEVGGRVLKVRRGDDLGRLRRTILRELGLTARLRPGAPVVFTARQRAILEEGGRDWKRRLLWGARKNSNPGRRHHRLPS